MTFLSVERECVRLLSAEGNVTLRSVEGKCGCLLSLDRKSKLRGKGSFVFAVIYYQLSGNVSISCLEREYGRLLSVEMECGLPVCGRGE